MKNGPSRTQNAPLEGEEGGLCDLEPFVTVTPLDLSSMELADIVKMEFILETYRDYLLKFLRSKQNSDLDGAIKSRCPG
jgi:hypothetical protein